MRIKNGLVVGVILLFIGVAFAPSMNANLGIDSELVEIITEICGLNGRTFTVQLTKEEAEDVDKIFENIRKQINKSNSREEVDDIFKEAVVEIDKYGLLGRLSIKQAQRLVVGNWWNKIEQKFIETIDNRNIGNSNDYDNAFCQIYGRINNSRYFNYWIMYYYILNSRSNYHIQVIWPAILGYIFRGVPIKLASFISIGTTKERDFGSNEYNPSMGEIWTMGIKGVKEWNGSLKGMFYEFTIGTNFADMESVGHIGVKLFRGLNFINADVNRFFGFAREVKIEYWNPPN